MEYISAPEAAKKWGISERRVQKLCAENRIPGVSKLGYMWLIMFFPEPYLKYKYHFYPPEWGNRMIRLIFP